MSLVVGPERFVERDEDAVSLPLREAGSRAITAEVLARGAAPARRQSAATTRRAIRTGRLSFAAKQIFFRRGRTGGAFTASSQPRSPWSSTRELLAEIVLPLLGLAVVVGTAVFWLQP